MAQNHSNNNAPGDGWEIDDNFDDVQTRRDIQPGRWLMRVASMEKKATKAGDKDYFNVCFEVIDVLKAEDEEVIGAKAWDIFNINQAALWKGRTEHARVERLRMTKQDHVPGCNCDRMSEPCRLAPREVPTPKEWLHQPLYGHLGGRNRHERRVLARRARRVKKKEKAG